MHAEISEPEQIHFGTKLARSLRHRFIQKLKDNKMELVETSSIVLSNQLCTEHCKGLGAALEKKITDVLWISIWDRLQPLWQCLIWDEPWDEDWYGEI